MKSQRSQLDEYIAAIANVIKHSKPDIVKDLFKASGAVGEFEVETIKQWLRRGKGRGFRDYFIDGKVNKTGFDNYFKTWAHYNWKQLQREFSLTRQNGFVDCDTESENDFYVSLLKQFIVMLKLPALEIVEDDKSTENSFSSQAIIQEKQTYQKRISEEIFDKKISTPSTAKRMYKIFSQSSVNCGIHDYVKGKPMNTFDIQVFVENINQDILNEFEEHFDEPVYKSIIEYLTELKKFHELSLLNTLKISSEEIDHLVLQQRIILESIERKIYELGGVFGTFIRDYETDNVDDIVYSWN